MSIRFDESRRLFLLDTEHSCYQMMISEIGTLHHLYYGKPVGDMAMDYLLRYTDRGFSGNPYECRENRAFSLDTLPQEYSCFGAGDYRIPSLKTVLANGSRTADLRYAAHTITPGKHVPKNLPHVREGNSSCETLTVFLKDETSGLTVKLFYGVFFEADVITRSAELINESDTDIVLEKAASACIDFPYGTWDLIHFEGRHCMERQAERMPLGHSVISIGSSRGMSSHHHNPFVILADRETNENAGDCYGFMLAWSGNHKAEAELDQVGSARIVTGISEDGFSWLLSPHETFTTPEVILSFSSLGLNNLSQKYHRIIRDNVCPPNFRHRKRPVLINNWEATYFDFDTEKLLGIARQAKELGVDLFVLDDGWFGARRDDNAGLGDWVPNETILPGGLKRLGTELNNMGLQFGLWIEPEMINEESDLYRVHPEWALRDPDHAPMMARNQLVLDMGRRDVQDYLFQAIDKLLKEAPISYLKWDFNRPVANFYSNALPAARQGETAHRFMLGTYALLERLTSAHPDVMIEGCAGGGGRFDAGMLYYCPQIWCSDDTDAVQRLKIQKGTSYGYPVCTMGAHVSAVPNHQTGRTTPFATRGVVALSGTFGYELDPRKLSEGDKTIIREQIAQFHQFSDLISEGDYYRLDRPETEKSFTAWEFAAKDGSEALVSIVITDVEANAPFPYIRLLGLDPEGMYRLEDTKECISGAALMFGGYALPQIPGDYPALILHFVREAKG